MTRPDLLNHLKTIFIDTTSYDYASTLIDLIVIRPDLNLHCP